LKSNYWQSSYFQNDINFEYFLKSKTSDSIHWIHQFLFPGFTCNSNDWTTPVSPCSETTWVQHKDMTVWILIILNKYIFNNFQWVYTECYLLTSNKSREVYLYKQIQYSGSCSRKSLKNMETVYLSYEKKSCKQQRTKKKSLSLAFC